MAKRRRRRSWVYDDGVTRTEALDVPPYPDHRFAFYRGATGDPSCPLQLFACGDDTWCDGCLRRRFNTPIFSIELVTGGVFEFTQHGRAYQVPARSVFLVQPGADNIMRLASGEIGTKLAMQITGALLPTILRTTGLNRVDVLQPANLAWLLEQYQKAKSLLEATPPGFVRESSSIAYAMIVELARSAGRARLPIVVRQAVELMEQNIGARLTIGDLCERLRVSKATLHRLFTKHMGTPPLDYFIGLKMDVARGLLANPAHSVKEVARQLGYDDPLYFSAQFKKRVGLSPRQVQRGSRAADTGPSAM
jgi:AraC-like DNA-binding protein